MGTGAFLAHGHFGSSDAKFYGVELTQHHRPHLQAAISKGKYPSDRL